MLPVCRQDEFCYPVSIRKPRLRNRGFRMETNLAAGFVGLFMEQINFLALRRLMWNCHKPDVTLTVPQQLLSGAYQWERQSGISL